LADWRLAANWRPICQLSPIGTFRSNWRQFAKGEKLDDLAGLFGGLSYLANWPIGRRSYCDSLIISIYLVN